MEEIDIWRTAKLLIDAHGANAELEATIRADQALWEGQSDAMNVWQRVGLAVAQLQQ